MIMYWFSTVILIFLLILLFFNVRILSATFWKRLVHTLNENVDGGRISISRRTVVVAIVLVSENVHFQLWSMFTICFQIDRWSILQIARVLNSWKIMNFENQTDLLRRIPGPGGSCVAFANQDQIFASFSDDVMRRGRFVYGRSSSMPHSHIESNDHNNYTNIQFLQICAGISKNSKT